jgi:hypothetical protein
MKSIHRLGLGAILTATSASVWLACGSDDSNPAQPAGNDGSAADVGAATADTGAGDDGGIVGADTGSAKDSGLATDTGAVVSCSAYCTAVMTTCTGSNKQYLDMGECMTACALLPLGTAGATGGNSVACRATHAALAASAGVVPHCWHAGPFGYGMCGTECESFCLLATSFCSADGGFDAGAPPYASLGDCTTACAGFPRIDDADGGALGVDGGYSAAGPTSGNTLDCREWHLDNALEGPGSASGQELHCKHVGATSPLCQ